MGPCKCGIYGERADNNLKRCIQISHREFFWPGKSATIFLWIWMNCSERIGSGKGGQRNWFCACAKLWESYFSISFWESHRCTCAIKLLQSSRSAALAGSRLPPPRSRFSWIYIDMRSGSGNTAAPFEDFLRQPLGKTFEPCTGREGECWR